MIFLASLSPLLSVRDILKAPPPASQSSADVARWQICLHPQRLRYFEHGVHCSISDTSVRTGCLGANRATQLCFPVTTTHKKARLPCCGCGASHAYWCLMTQGSFPTADDIDVGLPERAAGGSSSSGKVLLVEPPVNAMTNWYQPPPAS